MRTIRHFILGILALGLVAPALATFYSVRGAGTISLGLNKGHFMIGVSTSERGITGLFSYAEVANEQRLVTIDVLAWRQADFGPGFASLLGVANFRRGLEITRCIVQVYCIDGTQFGSTDTLLVSAWLPNGRWLYSACNIVEEGGDIAIFEH